MGRAAVIGALSQQKEVAKILVLLLRYQNLRKPVTIIISQLEITTCFPWNILAILELKPLIQMLFIPEPSINEVDVG